MILTGHMVYKNLYNRLFFSIFFFAIYFITINNKYLVLVFGTFIYLLVLYEVVKFFKKFFKFILFYLILSYLAFTLYLLIYFDYLIFNIFVFTIILFDTFSFFTGKIFGKKFIFKSISPKKTLEGYLGGFLLTNFFIICVFYSINIELNIITFITSFNLIIITSSLGDLTESYFKRRNNIKDSSNFLPGHGGFFDRFDSFIASIIILTLLSLL